MNFRDWYTDRVDVFRAVPVAEGSLTRHERRRVLADIPCRLYHTGSTDLRMEREAAGIEQKDWLQCDHTVDIRAGDELLIRRGAGLGPGVAAVRAFAAAPHYYFEPFGTVMPGLAHQEIRLKQEERVK